MKKTKNCLKKIISIYCLLLITNGILAQGNPLWTIPPKYYGSSGPVALPSYNFHSGFPLWNTDNYVDMAHAMMPDASGNPLFYVMDGYVFDKNSNQLDILRYYDSQCSGSGSGNPGVFRGGTVISTGYSQVLILPDPGNCKQYYILNSASIGSWVNSNSGCSQTL